MNITKKISLFLIISIAFQLMQVENIQARGGRNGNGSRRSSSSRSHSGTTKRRKPKTKRQKAAVVKRRNTNQANGNAGIGNIQNPVATLGLARVVRTNQQQQDLMMAMEFCNNNPDDNRCNNYDDDTSELSTVTPTV